MRSPVAWRFPRHVFQYRWNLPSKNTADPNVAPFVSPNVLLQLLSLSATWRLLDFMSAGPPPPPRLSRPPPLPPPIASARSPCSPPDLHSKFRIKVSVPDQSVPRSTRKDLRKYIPDRMPAKNVRNYATYIWCQKNVRINARCKRMSDRVSDRISEYLRHRCFQKSVKTVGITWGK